MHAPFADLKQVFMQAPILAYPNALLKGQGASFSQVGEDDEWHPTTYANQGLRGVDVSHLDHYSFKLKLLALKMNHSGQVLQPSTEIKEKKRRKL